jgi:pyruvate/2-oxoglutarate dehydrogenase complex dihydrolipoamide dehydrogenase (E3) component
VDGLAALRSSTDLVWTNREIVKARQVPAALVVLGGGAIGCELAQAFARYGSSVTVVEAGERILGPEEPEASEVVAKAFAEAGITVRQGVGATSVRAGGDGVELVLADGGIVTGAKLLVAAGRRPNLGGLGLPSLGVDETVRSLEVDDHMQVSEGLYAVGDITGKGAFTHVSVWQANVLVDHLLGRPENFGGYRGLAWVTFTDPEVGRVGMTEAQARHAGLTVKVGTQPIGNNTRGWIQHAPGFIKVIADADRNVLVGATVVAPHGGEILGLLTLAVHAQVPIPLLTSMHYAYPTLHRAVGEAIGALA